jgi:formylglycine-generating enzyme required for sulfatase activity/serine/threonine protein kinase
MDMQEIREFWKEHLPGVDFELGNPQDTYKKKFASTKAGALPPLTEFDPHSAVTLQISKEGAGVAVDDPDFDSDSDFDPDPETMKTMALTSEESLELAGGGAPATANLANCELLDKLGEGGMGIVYRGWQNNLCREVAVKKSLAMRGDVEQRQSFLAEAIVSGLLAHPNIVPVYELADDASGEPVLVMKLIQGSEWAELLHPKSDKHKEKAANFEFEDHLEILEQLCNAVSFAHSKGIIHCDLKPANVMIGDYGEVLLMDWGLAIDDKKDSRKSPQARLIRSKESVNGPSGTPSYMPYELAEGRGQKIGPWTDVYLLGAILHELLTGWPPHLAETFLEVLHKASKGESPELPESAPPELAQICRKALARETEARYQSASEFQSDLQRYLRHRESIVISDEAQKVLLRCSRAVVKAQEEGRLSIGKEQRNQLYEDFSTAVAGFCQAKMLWSKNPHCDKGEMETRHSYAKAALLFGDLSLAEAQVSKLKEQSEATAEIEVKIQARHEVRKQNQRAVTTLKYTLIGSASVIIMGLSVGLWSVNNARNETEKARALAELNEEKAILKENIARERLIRITQLSDIKRIIEFENEAALLWPANSTNIPSLRAWLQRCQKITERRPLHIKNLELYRKNALPLNPAFIKLEHKKFEEGRKIELLFQIEDKIKRNHKIWANGSNATKRSKAFNKLEECGHQLLEIKLEQARFLISGVKEPPRGQFDKQINELLTQLKIEIKNYQELMGKRLFWRFEKLSAQWEHDVLTDLVKRLDIFESQLVPEVRERIKQAERVHKESMVHAKNRWREVREAFTKDPVLKRIPLTAQEGLIPLGPDPVSGLWEFADLRTGKAAVRGQDGKLALTVETGLVFILIPGNTFDIGASDPLASADERHIHSITLAPYFISKYEMTQAQWQRVTGKNPSFFKKGPQYPVEQISWEDCHRVLFQLGMTLPTEAQWEYAARAGTKSIWWTGDNVQSLKNAANLADISYKKAGGTNAIELWKDDGYPEHAPIGSFRSNPFGLNDVVGNVWEWCVDSYASYKLPVEEETGKRLVFYPMKRAYRGGSWRFAAIDARSANRNRLSALGRDRDIGVRPARKIDD